MGVIQKIYGRISGLTEFETVTVSFETGEQCAKRLYFNYPVTINAIKGIVVKAVGATDAGTITAANATGNSAGGVITCAASDALGTEYVAAPTTNNTVPAGSWYQLTSLKTTAGGKVECTIQYKRA
jgi:hypothetical protein